jgi:LCP family protein required for cell wall assembly
MPLCSTRPEASITSNTSHTRHGTPDGVDLGPLGEAVCAADLGLAKAAYLAMTGKVASPLMADRPSGPEPGTPEYRWLYGESDATPADSGTRKRPLPQGQEPEHTRVLPTTPPAAPPRRPAPAQRPLGPAVPPSPTHGRGRRPRIRVVRWLVLLVVLWLAFLVATPFWALREVSSVDAMPGGDRPADQDGTTYLVVGSDSREGLSEAERKRLGTGGATGQRTDTIMLLHVGSGPSILMSVPRDSWVDIPGHGRGKINGTTNPDAYSDGGPSLLIRTLEHNTGIRIDHFVEIGFGGFVDVVDAVGGIEICPTFRMKDKDAHLDIKKGCQEADGVTALGYARSRKTDPRFGDITRAKHQREVVSAVGHEAVSPWSVVNPVRYWKLNMAAARTLTVSEGTGPIDLARFAWAMTRVNGKDGLTCGVPIADLSVEWDGNRSKTMFRHIIDDDTDGIPANLCTETGLPKSVTG